MGVRDVIKRWTGKGPEQVDSEQADAGTVVAGFVEAIGDHDLDRAFALVAADAEVAIPPVGVTGDAAQAREFFRATLAAFPDLTVRVRRTVVTPDGTVAVETTLEGTQAGDYLGIVNQEKHLDVDGSWLFRVRDGRIRTVHGYWCQNQVYRRLAVKRIDQPAIV
ncbi:MAG: ester cyclase [Pseudonocardia sp.]